MRQSRKPDKLHTRKNDAVVTWAQLSQICGALAAGSGLTWLGVAIASLHVPALRDDVSLCAAISTNVFGLLALISFLRDRFARRIHRRVKTS